MQSITLHGLGFIQVPLQASQRLNIWHPDLPRRRCFEHSSVHNHRFTFISQVLVGTQINHPCQVYSPSECHRGPITHVEYSHNGVRLSTGNRPWTAIGRLGVNELAPEVCKAGTSYTMEAYDFHRTEPGGDGRVATLMTKIATFKRGASSLCEIGVEPHDDFDRFQLSSGELWEFVRDVMEVM